MPRIRSLNPSATIDEDVATLSLAARYAWAYLPCFADRAGRMKDAPFTLKHAIFPSDHVNMEALLGELEHARHIIRYQAEGGRWIQIRSFDKYQHPHVREAPSTIPPPPDWPSGPGPVLPSGPSMSAAPLNSAEKDAPASPSNGHDTSEAMPGLVQGTALAMPSMMLGPTQAMPGPAVLVPGPGSDPGPGSEKSVCPAPARDLGTTEPEPGAWTGRWWYEKFKAAWSAEYRGETYRGNLTDSNAVAGLADLLAAMTAAERLAAEARAPKMFAEFLGDRDVKVDEARHRWSWFAARFDALRVAQRPVAAKKNGTGPPRNPYCELHKNGESHTRLPRAGPVSGCPQCKHNVNRTRVREGEPERVSFDDLHRR